MLLPETNHVFIVIDGSVNVIGERKCPSQTLICPSCYVNVLHLLNSVDGLFVKADSFGRGVRMRCPVARRNQMRERPGLVLGGKTVVSDLGDAIGVGLLQHACGLPMKIPARAEQEGRVCGFLSHRVLKHIDAMRQATLLTNEITPL